MTSSSPLLVVIGATASGKSDLAVELSLRLGGEVVNTDSVQLYRGMDIGAAKVTLAERRGVPHHLLDVWDVDVEASVAVFQTLAREAVVDVQGRGAVPVLTGGSSLYVRAVLDDLDFPGTDPAVRARWLAELDARGPEALHVELARVAPLAAEVILPSNGRRIVRALEVTEITGEPFVATMPAHESVFPDVTMIGLDVPRDVLDERIQARVHRMWADGLVDEVRRLSEVGLVGSRTASRALGYQQVLAFLAGDLTEDEAREETIRGTKAFARRQDRLFRKDPRIHWLPFDAPDVVEQALALV